MMGKSGSIQGILLLLFFAFSLWLRIYLPYDAVFTDQGTIFRGTDSWYHMRLVENRLHHFPQGIQFDPYTHYPYGQKAPFAPLYDFTIALLVWIIGLGAPSKELIEIVGSYFPAFLGTLTILPVYILGKDIFNRNVGLFSAGLISVLPGEFLGRTLLGFTDHHAAEVFLSSVTMLFLVKALRNSPREPFSWKSVNKGWKGFKRSLIFSFLAGLGLASYLLTWTAGLFMIFILFCSFTAQYITNFLRKQSSDSLCIITLLLLSVTLILIIPFSYRGFLEKYHVPSLVICGAASIVFGIVSKLMLRKVPVLAYFGTLAAIALLGLVSLHLIEPNFLIRTFNVFIMLFPTKHTLAIGEALPLLYQYGVVSLPLAMWKYFTTTFLIAMTSLFWLIYALGKQQEPERNLLLVWSIIMFIATFAQRRFAYYLAVNISLLAGFACEGFVQWSSIKKVKPGAKLTKGSSASRLRSILAVGVVILIAFCPNIWRSVAFAKRALRASSISQDEYAALQWMKENTPDPFNNPGFYYELYDPPDPGERYKYPESAYGVMSWWSYGNWITFIAHRIPNGSPIGQTGATKAANFFLAQNESEANGVLDRLDTKYVVIDRRMAIKAFSLIARVADVPTENFFETCYLRGPSGKLIPVMIYYPAYYRTMLARLYNFKGRASVPDKSTWIVWYRETVDKKGNKYKIISDMRLFSNYEGAMAYLRTGEHPNGRIVGKNPFKCPIPVDGLTSYELIYQSTSAKKGSKGLPTVRIFEYKSPL